jgi:hypothetical protein
LLPPNQGALFDPFCYRADTIVPGTDPLTIWPSDGTATPMWGKGGKANGPNNPQELNRYAYVNNNPVRYTDPTGHFAWILDAAVIGAAINTVAYAVVQRATGGEITAGGLAVAAFSGLATGALTAAGGPLVAGLAARYAMGAAGKFAINTSISVGASVLSDAAGSALSKPVDVIQEKISGKKPGETTPDPLKAATSGGVSSLSSFAGELDGMADLATANRTMNGPTPPKYAWSKSMLNDYSTQQAIRGSNAKMIAWLCFWRMGSVSARR